MIVFVSGYLGLNALTHMVKSNTIPDLIVLADEDQTKIEEFAVQNSLNYKYYYKNIQVDLAKEYELLNKDWIISFWSSHIIKRDLLECFNYSLNVHPSLVPLHQGNDCAAWTIREKTKAGVSIMTMKNQLDVGDVYIQREISTNEGIRGKELYEILLDECCNIFYDSWMDIYNQKLIPKPQKGLTTFHTRKDTNNDRVKEFDEKITLDEFVTWGLAHDFSPKTTAVMNKNGKQYKIVLDIEVIDERS